MEIKTALSSNIDAAGMRAKYDECAKILLSNKYILAWIMKECISEFRDIPIDEIRESCIISDPRAMTALHRDEEAEYCSGDQISTINVEDVTMNEGIRAFDIRFDAVSWDMFEPVFVIINIEAQKNPDPGYPIVKRAVYYCGRLISGQHNTVFQNSEYGKIRKVYSIWVCSTPPIADQNSIVKYSLKRDLVEGECRDTPDTYDLLAIILLNLGNSVLVEKKCILRLLTVLLSHKMKPAEKKKVLSEEFDIPMTSEIDEEVEKMCNLSEGIWVEAMNEGRAEGRVEGLEERAKLTALLMAKDDMPLDLIAKYVSCSTDVVQSWIAAAE